jgi:hypothetical protein
MKHPGAGEEDGVTGLDDDAAERDREMRVARPGANSLQVERLTAN